MFLRHSGLVCVCLTDLIPLLLYLWLPSLFWDWALVEDKKDALPYVFQYISKKAASASEGTRRDLRTSVVFFFSSSAHFKHIHCIFWESGTAKMRSHTRAGIHFALYALYNHM